jgi:hypothetical protein
MNRNEIIQHLRDFPSVLEALVAPLTDGQLDHQPADGEWTVRQNVQHLADAHTYALIRLRWPLTEEHPQIKTYDQDAWARLPDYALPIEHALAILRGTHARMVALLEGLEDAGWSRVAHHPDWGVVSVQDIAAIYAKHGTDHLDQIRRALQG